MSYTDDMATNGKVPYGYETPAVLKKRERPAQEHSRNLPPWVTNTALAGMVGFVVLALVLVIANAPGYQDSIHKLEVKQLGDLQAPLLEVAADESKAAQLQTDEIREARGAEFYEALLQARLLEDSMVSKLVSLKTTTDRKADKAWLDEPDGKMPADACSYTGPAAGELVELLNRKGDQRVVLITFNARNWNNYPDHGIVVFWTDGDVAEFLPFEYFEENYGITEEEWADPAGKLFGKKAPFQHTYE